MNDLSSNPTNKIYWIVRYKIYWTVTYSLEIFGIVSFGDHLREDLEYIGFLPSLIKIRSENDSMENKLDLLNQFQSLVLPLYR